MDPKATESSTTEDPARVSWSSQLPRRHHGDVEQGWQHARPEEMPPISRQVFEKIYLNPPIDVRGDFRNILANPTPLGLVGFLAAALPLSCQLMNLRGAGGIGGNAATIGLLVFFGGMLQMLACIMEWILGNTFSFLVFGTFGAGLLSLAAPSLPNFNLQYSYLATSHPVPTSQMTAAQAAEAAEFYSAYAFALLVFGLLTVTFGFCALRTNIIFVFLFAIVSGAVFLFAGSYWALAQGNEPAAAKMQKAVGAIIFTCCVCAWYLLVANLLEVLEFGFQLPVGDLSAKLGRRLSRAQSYKDRSRSI